MKYNVVRILTIFGLLWLVACDKSAPVSPVKENVATTNAAAPAKLNPLFEKLIGRWERPDGGYVLELRSVDAEGKFDAGYFNPGAIKVERAQAFSEAGTTKLFVILRDVNYPGCTYKLSYDSKADQLFGEYFQAAVQETYPVTFARLK
ncbi:MAG: hypothetical protein EXS24_00570 [Pedosphaera sp.]|nr:hypothetical protein [Pedosphaera sp.]